MYLPNLHRMKREYGKGEIHDKNIIIRRRYHDCIRNGQETEIRDNREGALSILKNDIYALVQSKNEQLAQTKAERDVLAEYMVDISHQLKTPITSMMIMMDLLEDAEPQK